MWLEFRFEGPDPIRSLRLSGESELTLQNVEGLSFDLKLVATVMHPRCQAAIIEGHDVDVTVDIQPGAGEEGEPVVIAHIEPTDPWDVPFVQLMCPEFGEPRMFEADVVWPAIWAAQGDDGFVVPFGEVFEAEYNISSLTDGRFSGSLSVQIAVQ